MRLRPLFTFSAALAALLTIAGCGRDTATAPSQPTQIAPASSASHTLLGSPITVTPMLRVTPLASNIVVSKTIGLLGGTISVPGAGLTVVVPPLAVSKSTTFKVTARAGYAVAYDFEPHGTNFLLPLVATQNLTGMQGGSLLSLLQLGYYPDGTHPTTVTELLTVTADLLHLTAVSSIWHFSGYIYLTGRDDGGTE
jgi:hypothetical protein